MLSKRLCTAMNLFKKILDATDCGSTIDQKITTFLHVDRCKIEDVLWRQFAGDLIFFTEDPLTIFKKKFTIIKINKQFERLNYFEWCYDIVGAYCGH